MLSFKQFRFVLFQVLSLSLLLLGLHGKAAALSIPDLSVTTESAGWYEINSIYRLHGTVMRSPGIELVDIAMSFTADEVPRRATGLPLTIINIFWGPETQCATSPVRICNEWVATLSTSSLPPGSYNIVVEANMDDHIIVIDTFGDDGNERCSYNCGRSGSWPTCNAGLCQQGGMDPNDQLPSANVAFVASEQLTGASFVATLVPILITKDLS